MGELYRLDFPNGKSYIGISELSAAIRFRGHKLDAMKKTKRLIYNAWKKHGEPKLVVLAVLEDECLFEAERKAIKSFATFRPRGYNSTEGGEKSPMLYPEISKKVSDSMKGKLWSAERRLEHSRKLLGNQRLKGHKHSEESKEKMSKSRLGKKFENPERSRKISEALSGKIRTDETKALNSIAAKSWMEKRKFEDPEWWKDWIKRRGEAIKKSFERKIQA